MGVIPNPIVAASSRQRFRDDACGSKAKQWTISKLG
jgi:hypothetical protein